jgi:hypothetical protein
MTLAVALVGSRGAEPRTIRSLTAIRGLSHDRVGSRSSYIYLYTSLGSQHPLLQACYPPTRLSTPVSDWLETRKKEPRKWRENTQVATAVDAGGLSRRR